MRRVGMDRDGCRISDHDSSWGEQIANFIDLLHVNHCGIYISLLHMCCSTRHSLDV